MSPSRSRTVNLLCPTLAKIVPFVVLEDHGLDLGTLAGIFGIEPSTLRLNGHFISRGVNFISSVTWESVLSFFAKKGYSIGKSSQDAVIVDGKFCDDNDRAKAGSQYSNDMGVGQRTEDSGIGSKRKPWLEDVNLLKRRKLYGDDAVLEKDNLSGKRKLCLGDVNLLKRRKMERLQLRKTSGPILYS
ncbi:hypothetical protein H6P81_012137 [Aristolochia fimbriata]|uniref:Uncharacterized protein n=1 Tax=Aristolochia fimbriata TaxID=158543 RepID=A0AAV7EBH9_ARIFI|nr:hypothetical protein H6P81_012137 [Aristolochia fimbriata]